MTSFLFLKFYMCTSHTTHLVPKLTAFLCPGTNFVDEFLGTSRERAKINVCNGNICNKIAKLYVYDFAKIAWGLEF